MSFSNRLSPAEAERLALLLEECGEVQQVIGKILRHGYDSRHPDGGPTNRGLLAAEIGDIHCAGTMLIEAGDVSEQAVRDAAAAKRRRIGKYLHHQWEATQPTVDPPVPCDDGDCNPYVAYCGARFCTYEGMSQHKQKCPTGLTAYPADPVDRKGGA